MASVSYDLMSAQLLAGLPELRPIADRVCGIEGMDITEENPYSVFGNVLAPHLAALLDADASPVQRTELQRIFGFLEAFIADPQWTSGGYNYAENVVALEVLEHLLSEGAEERLRRVRPFLGPAVARSLGEMEARWEQKHQRHREAEADTPATAREKDAVKRMRRTSKVWRTPIRRPLH